MHMKAILVSALVALLAGCNYDLPAVDSGSFELHYDGGIEKEELAQSQVEALSDWLRAHRTGWNYKMQSRPPALHLFLKRQGVTVVMVYIGKDSVAVGELVRPITAQERAKFYAVLTGFLMDDAELNRLLPPTWKQVSDRPNAHSAPGTRFAHL